MREYDKLVRDRIPEVVRENDETPVTHTVDGEAYRERLREKLVEEATEFRDDPTVEELGDVLDVVAAIREAEPVDEGDLQRKRRAKAAQRGGFEDGVVLDRVEE
ncbi:nucleoside triphosphate pyrophosphohydrolase [Haloarchaeobius sp. FL176]|uniref:nucleoside triphosphate pyrophosphohydrolase n=1 Tax=Haloarchaeobius sp. FL176 TaxID=2967129 RepID=UPI0021479B42|nr:nucleoside triphosphate pyrophosphohydrolase [Haloarchaeobius sp. FL176]